MGKQIMYDDVARRKAVEGVEVEVRRVKPVEGVGDKHAEVDDGAGISVGEEDVHAAAEFAGELARVGREAHGHEADSGDVEAA